MMKKQTLYHKGKAGELRVWSVWTEEDKIKTEYGVLNGEMQVSVKKATPKNVGRSNETSAVQQAELEAQSLYQFKLDRKYSTTQASAKEPLLLPMLAKNLDERKLSFPCYAQPKLDGVRCLAFWSENKIKLISRAGKEWTVPKHINAQLEHILPKDSMFDGELYIHGKSCQTITSYVKKWRDIETPTIEYHIYDMPIVDGIEDLPFESRFGYLRNLLEFTELENLKLVETKQVDEFSGLKKYEAQLVLNGYEGAIARNTEGLYLFGYRSNDLQKIKTFQDAEFKVVGCRDGVGKFEGCAVFVCQNDLTTATFECTLAVSMQERANMYRSRDYYIGKKLTVKFFDRTDDQLPRFPVGKLFREEQDLG